MQLSLEGRDVVAGSQTLIADLDPGLTAEPDPLGVGLFLRAKPPRSTSRFALPVGTVPLLRRYTLCHRYEPYWMKPAVGTRLGGVPAETQFFLAELVPGNWLLLVPVIDEPWRFSLRGHSAERLELLGETGDPHLGGWGGLALFVASGTDPFDLLRAGARSVCARLETASLRQDKPLPSFVDTFGWCTWDAFYHDVSADLLRKGLEHFRAGGLTPRFVILDDGWQTESWQTTGERRLTSFAANAKFGGDLSNCIREAKAEFGVQTFLVWHAIIGYWGGVDGEALPGYGVVEQPRRFGEGIMAHMPRCNEDWWGALVGLVPEQHVDRFFDDYHRSLAQQGVDGVKVDNQAVLEALGARQGGRVRLTRLYRRALETSAQRHFGGRMINCMANAQETFYGSPHSTLTRTSIDFFPKRPETHAAHLYANAHVGLWFGHFMHPDWDMFQSGHAFGAFHAAGRALSGGPVYVSDKPGQHDFSLLRKLVCSDGSVLRADGPGQPTLGTLCVDPTREPVPLAIWNRVGRAGIIGVFHALYAEGRAQPVSGELRSTDVPGLEGARFACHAHVAGRLEVLERGQPRGFVLAEREFEVFSLVPIERGFAAVGLLDKFNAPAAISALEWVGSTACQITLRDCGEFLGFSEKPPRAVTGTTGGVLSFAYDPPSGAVRVRIAEQADRTFTISW